MKNIILLGGLAALGTGIVIGTQSILSGRASALIGPINTGFWTNFLGGCLAGLLILGIGAARGFGSVAVTRAAFPILLVSGALGIMTIMGVAFAVSKAGAAAGMAAIILGQMIIGVVSDRFGWGGAEAIPLDIRRVAGLALMAVSILLLLPRK
jgi:transporter family-2 protein